MIAAIVAGAVGVLLGWVVAAVAFVPHALYVLCTTSLRQSLAVAASVSALLGGAVAIVDRLCYGSWQVTSPRGARF